jgi:hypothetical protein
MRNAMKAMTRAAMPLRAMARNSHRILKPADD